MIFSVSQSIILLDGSDKNLRNSFRSKINAKYSVEWGDEIGIGLDNSICDCYNKLSLGLIFTP